MSLPKMNSPVYTVKVPSTNQQVTFRPFTVREEKALLLAQQSEDTGIMSNTLKLIIEGCVKEKINVDKLAIFDVEYLFTQIRAKSVGEMVDLIFTCAYCVDEDEKPKNKMRIGFDLTEIEVVRDPNHTNKIHLFGECGVIMNYPNLNTFRKADGKEEDINAIIEVVTDCIEAIYSGDEMFYASEQTREELEEFVLNLTKHQFELLEEFFVTIPKFKKDVEFNCPACKAHNKVTLEGTASFF